MKRCHPTTRRKNRPSFFQPSRASQPSLRLEALEPRQLLAADLVSPQGHGDQPVFQGFEPIDNPFEAGSVPLDQMLARAAVQRYVPGELIVAFQAPEGQLASLRAPEAWAGLPGLEEVSVAQTILSHGGVAGRDPIQLVRLELGASTSVTAAMQTLGQAPHVLWSSPNFVYDDSDPREFVPNDPRYPNQYHHARMQNNLAWDVTLGEASIIVGVTDDGVLITHPDLAPNIWVNAGEIAGNGVDDDGNGYIDDVFGWDTLDNDNNVNPDGSDDHGIHVAGIAAARTDNAIGVAGTAGRATVMPIKFYKAGTSSWTGAVVAESFAYGADNGAQIITTSYNINGFVGDPVFTAGLQYSYDAGVLHFNSAGNNNDLNPARQAFEQTLLVASTTQTDTKSSFSNYGVGVDIAAPGSDILSTLGGNSYGTNSGTSMASPNAAGAAALIWSANPTWSRDMVAAQLLGTADNIDAANPAYAGLLGSGRVNSFKAVTQELGAPRVAALEGLPANFASTNATDLESFTIVFDQVMDPAAVSSGLAYDLRAAGADGLFDTPDDVVLGVNVPNSYMVGTNQLSLASAAGPLEVGEYRFSVVATEATNPFGTPLDGNSDGVGGDDFETYFSVTAFERVGPLGGLISYNPSVEGTLPPGSLQSDYSFTVSADELVSAVARPTAPTATLTLALEGSGNSYTASAPGQPVYLPATAVSAGGLARILVSGDLSTTFRMEVFRNAELQNSSDSSVATPLDGSFLPLGSGRYAAVGELTGSPPVPTFTRSNDASLFVDISRNGQPLNLGDDGEANINVSVSNLLFPAGTYTVSNNGAFSFGAGQDISWTNGELPATGFSTPTLLPFWDDIDSEGGNVFWQQRTIDGIPALIVQWHERPHFSNVGSATFQLQVFASGPVAARFVYPDVDFGDASYNFGASATIGYQANSTIFSQFSFNSAAVFNHDVLDLSTGIGVVDSDDYTIDLTGKVGQSLDVVLQGIERAVTAGSLELLGPGGAVLATGTVGAGNYDLGIHGFIVTQDGTHTLRVSGELSTRYALVVTESLAFDTEPNSSLSVAQPIDHVSGALGFLDGDLDIYQLHLSAGTEVLLTTSTPRDGAHHSPRNNLDPNLSLRGPDDTLLASDADSLDGKNARISFIAAEDGVYSIEVGADVGLGEYLLHYDLIHSTVDGDFNDDGIHDCADVNALVAAIAAQAHDAAFDLTSDGLVDSDDLEAWLLEGALANGFANAYLPGDANLDGVVDVSDYNLWSSHKFTPTAAWCNGDFNADGVVDVSDFGVWNAHKFLSSATSVSAPSVYPTTEARPDPNTANSALPFVPFNSAPSQFSSARSSMNVLRGRLVDRIFADRAGSDNEPAGAPGQLS